MRHVVLTCYAEAKCGAVELKDMWKHFGKENLEANGYQWAEQRKLISVYLSRTIRQLDKGKMADAVAQVFQLSTAAQQVHPHAFTTIRHLHAICCAATVDDSKAIEEALEYASVDDVDEVFEVILATPTGRCLKDDAKDVVGKRANIASIADKLQNIAGNSAKTFTCEKYSECQKVKVFAQHMQAAICGIVLSGFARVADIGFIR